MLKYVLSFLLAAILALSLCACGSDAKEGIKSGGDSSATPPVPPMHTETFWFGEDMISISLRDTTGLYERWDAEAGAEGTKMPFTDRTHNIEIIMPPGEKIKGTITVGKTIDDEEITREQISDLITARAEMFLPEAAEETVTYHDQDYREGVYVKYFTLTDASLIDTDIPGDEYLFVTVYYTRYSGNYYSYATLLFDDEQERGNATIYMMNVLGNLKATFAKDTI